MTVKPDDIDEALGALGVMGTPVMVHCSLKSFGTPVEGGPDAVIDGFLKRGCTLLVPSFTQSCFAINPPLNMRPARNGVDYSRLDPPDPDALRTSATFHPNCGLIDSNMGKLPAEVIRKKSVRRGNHPLNSFSAVGPQAEHLVSGQNYADVYAPIRALINHNGLIVLIGVGLNRMTALHLAEQQAGRNLFVRWALNTDGRPCIVNTGGCSEGFPRLQPVLQKLRRSIHVHSARLFVYVAREAVETAVSAIRGGAPTKCDDPMCLRCADAAAGGPGFN